MLNKLTNVLSTTLLLVLSGCQEKSDFVPVSGEVLYEGKPLASGVIMFQPTAGPPSRGTIENGQFALENSAGELGGRIGLNKVRIASRAAAPGGDAEMALGKSLIPEHYGDFNASGLTAEVKPEGNGPFRFELTAEASP
ncbi:MAG: hypothetical protein KF847_20180 [Pirellulales bacterium]|nr:hypothetical protein [Pirellulales bacterium]